MATTGDTGPAARSQTTKILLDVPSTGPALGFRGTALAFAQIIEDSSPRFAIGIFGGWGSGKTTLMRAIVNELPDTVVTVEFNAWRFEREPQLLVPLLDTVRTALVDWSKREDADTREIVRNVAGRIGRVIRSLASGLSGEVGLPGAAKVSYDVSRAVDAFAAQDDPDQPQSLYVAAFRELSQAFAEFSAGGVTRVVVFVDDLDRCLPENALDVLESIKLFFDLPGFIFVVGLDEDVVQRAVRTRFASGSSQSIVDHGGTVTPTEGQLERDYVEKIFQVPYRLPPMVAEQLSALLETMYTEADLPAAQLEDFRTGVTPHLRYVAVQGRINPREVKRFLNTYTLQTLVRPDLERSAVLPLQTLLFRYEWRHLYDAILTDSVLFIDALNRYRNGEELAFEDLSPELSALAPELGEYLRSGVVEPLCQMDSLDAYMSSLESTRTALPWLTDVYREIGRLRGELRRFRALPAPIDEDARQLGGVAKEAASKLSSFTSYMAEANVQVVSTILQELESAALSIEKQTGTELEDSANQISDLGNRLYRELRSMRDTLTPLPRS